MSVDRKIIQEIERYRKINNYIFEQEEPVDPAADLGGDVEEPMDIASEPEPVDVETDPDVEIVDEPGSEGEEVTTDVETEDGGTEELDITDLVTTQKDMSEKQEEYMETMMDKLNDLTTKLSDMDQILQKINDLENKVEKYRQKSPEEKLQLRSLDSYPYNQNLLTILLLDFPDPYLPH